MNKIPINMKSATRLLMAAMMLVLAFGALSFAQGYRYQSDNTWSFGVMGDTQWFSSEDPEGVNPEYVAAGIAGALQNQFIKSGVRFVIQTGDLTDRAGNAGLAARAWAAQPLYDAAIGFFPMRGNHETYGYIYGRDPDGDLNIPAFKLNFPQTQGLENTFGATNFSSPAIDILTGLSYSFDYGDTGNSARFVVVDVEATTSKTSTTTPASHATYGPGAFYIYWTVYKHTEDVAGTTGAYVDGVWTKVPATIPAGTYFRISGGPCTDFYGFDNGIVTWFNTTGANYSPIADYLYYVNTSTTIAGEYYPGAQQDWISGQLDTAVRGTEHAFVFSHRPMMGANHADGFFGSNPGSKPSQQNPFYASLVDNGVRYMISGHDHIHNRALVESPNGLYELQQIINTGASTKFYMPGSLNSFIGGYGDVKQRETQISQEVHNIGYYIYKVDGPRVTVDYFSDSTGDFQDGADFPYGAESIPAPLYTPQFNFVKKETWGYSTNGQQFFIEQGDPYTAVEGSFGGTAAKILEGVNQSTTTDYTPTVIDDNDTPDDPSDDVVLSAPRPLTKTVNTGWVTNPDPKNLLSDIFSLWGMSELGAEGMTDTYALEMSYVDPRVKGKGKKLGNGGFRLCSLDKNGHWVNAANLNVGVKNAKDQKFVKGPCNLATSWVLTESIWRKEQFGPSSTTMPILQ